MTTIQELYEHQAWADAEHWRAMQAHGTALGDPALFDRLHHIHLVQRAFLSIVRGERVAITKAADFAASAELKRYAAEYHAAAAQYIGSVTPDRLAESITIPWFKDPPISVTVGQALTQAAMHSHYHRGQNATRLRELGGEPPLTDLIVWYWKGRPAADWGPQG
jgi:uncharacterized damage-inducible protein DinB